MASSAKRLSTNVPGNFFVDSTCINCDACRELAPATFHERDDASAVYAQPVSPDETGRAYQALVTCPVASIGVVKKDPAALRQAVQTFPQPIDGVVSYNGFNSEKSFGAHSYLLRLDHENWLIDSPRYTRHLVEAFERMGGIRYIVLSHADDVGDAGRYAQHFGAVRIIHDDDAAAMPDAEWRVRGTEVVAATEEIRLIPVPGHTMGSMAVLAKERYLFTGDHLWWDPDRQRLDMPSMYVESEAHLLRSTERLLDHRFDWVLPGHGHRVHLPSRSMRAALDELIARCRQRRA